MASRLFFRSLASSAKKAKPPIELFGLDGTYANALYSAAVDEMSIPKAYDGLTKINKLLESDPKVSGFTHNPSLTQQDRVIVSKTIADTLKLEKTLTNFLVLLAENNRLSNFKGIYEKFSLLNDAEQGIVVATISSAKPLDPKILKRLQTVIGKSSFVGDDKQLKVNNVVLPDLLGGLVVEVADKTVDVSLASRMTKLNQAITDYVT